MLQPSVESVVCVRLAIRGGEQGRGRSCDAAAWSAQLKVSKCRRGISRVCAERQHRWERAQGGHNPRPSWTLTAGATGRRGGSR
eukprot:1982745-Pleurochrysis_carterae.AAC.1